MDTHLGQLWIELALSMSSEQEFRADWPWPLTLCRWHGGQLPLFVPEQKITVCLVGGWSEVGWVGPVSTAVCMQFEVDWVGSRENIHVRYELDSPKFGGRSRYRRVEWDLHGDHERCQSRPRLKLAHGRSSAAAELARGQSSPAQHPLLCHEQR